MPHRTFPARLPRTRASVSGAWGLVPWLLRPEHARAHVPRTPALSHALTHTHTHTQTLFFLQPHRHRMPPCDAMFAILVEKALQAVVATLHFPDGVFRCAAGRACPLCRGSCLVRRRPSSEPRRRRAAHLRPARPVPVRNWFRNALVARSPWQGGGARRPRHRGRGPGCRQKPLRRLLTGQGPRGSQRPSQVSPLR